MSSGGTALCALCCRPLGRRVEKHHVVPKSRGGGETVPVHPICHRTIHALFNEHELAGVYRGLDRVRDHPDMAKFLKWIGGKPPDFHVPTRRARDRRR